MKRLELAVVLLFLCAMPAHAAMSKAEAKKLIAEWGLPETAEGLLAPLNISSPDAVKLVEAFLTLGVPADREVTYVADGNVTLTRYPLNYLLMFWCGDPSSAAKAKLLVDAGADPNTTDPENDWAALAQAHSCADVIRVLLAAPKKPDVNRVDRNGNTVLHYVIRFGDDRQIESVRMLLDAGFDIARFRKELLKEARQKPEIFALLEKVDWKSLPPYPERTAREAKDLLHRPGAATTIDEQMWDGITQREPLRLALALQAGANVRQTRSGTGYTPLVLLAERCDQNDASLQSTNANLLIDAGADLNGVDAHGANALILASGDCPAGVVKALLTAGISPHARSTKGTTALYNAITDDRADVVAMLLDAGVDPKKEPYNVRALAAGKKQIEALLKKKRK